MKLFWYHLDRFESYACRLMLAVFVALLFAQIIARQMFGTSITWIEELSVILFVWFAYFGASYAARMAAHNRISFHLERMNADGARIISAFGDLLWLAFNAVFIYYAIEFISLLKPFVKAQTLGWQMRYVYLVLPVSFTMMSLRILQVNYMKFFLGRAPSDPDRVDMDELREQASGGRA